MEKSFVPTNLVINKLIKFNIQKQFTIIHLSSTSNFQISSNERKLVQNMCFKNLFNAPFDVIWVFFFFVFSKVVQV
jgi:hypothetical protein